MENNEEKNKQVRNLWSTVILIILGVIGVTFGIYNLLDSNTSNSGKIELTSSKMNCTYNYLMEGWETEIIGTIKNNTEKNYSYVSVEFSIYDSSGNNLGTIMTNMNNLDAGETWRFSAESFEWYDLEPKSYKLKDISYW